MKIPEKFIHSNKKILIPLGIGLVVLAIIYLLLKVIFPGFNPHTLFKQYIYAYESDVARQSTYILNLIGINVHSFHNEVYYDHILLNTVSHKYLEFKWLLFLVGSIWITPAKILKKIIFTVPTIIVFIILNILHFVFLFIITRKPENIDGTREMLFTFIAFIYIFIFAFWISKNKNSISEFSKKYNLDFVFLRGTYIKFLIILTIAVIFNNFILYYLLKFDNYKYFILYMAEKILLLMKYEVNLAFPYLVGSKGDIHFVTPCLGFKLLVTFVAFVFLTSTNYKKSIIYSITGLLILNLANILRIVAIFIHLQSDLDEQASIQFHDYLTYVTYGIVFILWIVWLERYSDIWPYLRKKAT